MNRIVVASNRVPLPSGSAGAVGGLAVALRDLLARRGGLWFGWSGEVAESTPGPLQRQQDGRIEYATLDLTRQEYERYYNEFSNGTLWPLLHSMPELMLFNRRSAAAYGQVNARLAEALAGLIRPDDLVWVHDYHLMALPVLLRAGGVHAPIGFFLHVPFPAPDLLANVPEAGSLVRDLLASDLLGFQTTNDLDNFVAAAIRLAGAEQLRGDTLRHGTRRVRLGVFPVEIDTADFAETARVAATAPPVQALRRSMAGQDLLLGVDRLDPTKGLIQRLAGYRRLLETRPAVHRRCALLQIAAESRTEVGAYRDLREAIDLEAGSINSTWSDPDWSPLRLVARSGSRETIAGYMRLARVGLVTPLRDGMNLVAKEYVAAQDPDDPGVLVLSRFAGAAGQLGAALLVNPHDPDEIADAIHTALDMTQAQRQERWLSCWHALEGKSALGWGRSFVAALLRAGTAHAGAPTLVKQPTPGGAGNLREGSIAITVRAPGGSARLS